MRIRHTFGPVLGRGARILILGSMPGEASMKAGQYYAHPRNQFWDLMGDLLGAGRNLSYRRRLDRLRRSGVALWDVVGECVRPGSMDHRIDPASIRPNDFAELFRRAPGIRAIFFNGAAAARFFRRHVRGAPDCSFRTLPSTSPACASKTYAQKLKAWSAITRQL
jgi:hypoxanthine-DNA glycosylase